ncbi:MAG: hypothetical protein ACM3X6_00025 [Patescibacteria group bacterium]
MTFREFAAAAEEIWAGLPAPLLDDLPGGLVVLPAARAIPGRRGLVALGEYQRGPAGNRIVLYHGSFARVLSGRGAAAWREQLQRTIGHELRHHMEARAGRADLARAEERERGES